MIHSDKRTSTPILAIKRKMVSVPWNSVKTIDYLHCNMNFCGEGEGHNKLLHIPLKNCKTVLKWNIQININVLNINKIMQIVIF